MILISIPVGYTLGVTYGWGLSGLWVGYGTQGLCLTIMYTVILIRLDWDATATNAA